MTELENSEVWPRRPNGTRPSTNDDDASTNGTRPSYDDDASTNGTHASTNDDDASTNGTHPSTNGTHAAVSASTTGSGNRCHVLGHCWWRRVRERALRRWRAVVRYLRRATIHGANGTEAFFLSVVGAALVFCCLVFCCCICLSGALRAGASRRARTAPRAAPAPANRARRGRAKATERTPLRPKRSHGRQGREF